MKLTNSLLTTGHGKLYLSGMELKQEGSEIKI